MASAATQLPASRDMAARREGSTQSQQGQAPPQAAMSEPRDHAAIRGTLLSEAPAPPPAREPRDHAAIRGTLLSKAPAPPPARERLN